MSVCLSLGLLVPSVADQKTAVDFFLVEETICVNKPTVHSGEVAVGGSVAVAVVDRCQVTGDRGQVTGDIKKDILGISATIRTGPKIHCVLYA